MLPSISVTVFLAAICGVLGLFAAAYGVATFLNKRALDRAIKDFGAEE